MRTERLDAGRGEDLARAGELLRAGELVAVPTETVYGLAADARNPRAVERIFAAKGRPRSHPLIVHIAVPEQLETLAVRVPARAYALARHFWPGPLTLLLEKHDDVPGEVTGGLPTIGVRMPDHPVLLGLLRRFGLAVAAPSANRYQRLSPTCAEQVLAGLDGRIAAVLDGGPCAVGTESTIVRLAAHGVEILRPGPISAAELGQVLGCPVAAPAAHVHAVSGNQRNHYQPSSRVVLKSASELAAALSRSSPAVGWLVHSDVWAGAPVENMQHLGPEHRRYRRELYGALYRLDRLGLDEIWVERPPPGPEWADIRDRLARAAGREEPYEA